MNSYPKGSEWNKWDLHVHTPASILSNEYGGDWDTYVTALFKTAIKENIIAIGITDYYFIDGYKKIKNDYLSNDIKLKELFTEDEILKIKNIFVFPNIELRINKLIIGKEKDLKWNRKVNYHVLFSDQISPEDIEQNFINRLEFENEGFGEGSTQKVGLNKRNLTELGNRLLLQQPSFNSYSPIQVGMLCASVDDSKIVNLLTSQNLKFKGNYLLALPADEDLSTVHWNSQGHLSRKLLFQKSHIVFSSNSGTIDFSLGKRHSSVAEFINEFCSLKPCLWGSDAHCYKKLFKPDNNRATWIKSNPTFEGLKQVVYEPEERVRIQENIPEAKTPYLVIDKVRFIDKTSKNIFQPSWIELNQNLNAIIGGKSSGKSLLLYHIAKSIDPQQVDLKSKLVQACNYADFVKDYPFDFEVLWKNGDKNILSSADENGAQITFIPQLYINHLAEENGESQLTELIESILEQNERYKKFLENQNSEIQQCKTNINSAIDERLVQLDTLHKLTKEKNDVGNNEKVGLEIKRLKEEIEKLRKESGFTEEQNNEYKRLSKKIATLNRVKIHFVKTIESLKSYLLFINTQILNFSNTSTKKLIEFQTNTIEEHLLNKINSNFNKTINESKQKLNDEIEELVQKFNLKIINIDKRIDSSQLSIKPFQAKVKNQSQLKKTEEKLKTENAKLDLIIKYEKEINGVIEKGKQAVSDIFTHYEQMFNCYKSINEELQKPEFNKIDSDIELQSRLIFDNNKFRQFTNLFDKRTRLNNHFTRIFDDDNNLLYEEKTHIEAIREVFNKLKTEIKPIKLKINVGISDLFYKLLDNYFKINYRINYKGDNILQMSPGKRGLVLLQLILHISNASHPILIDQPEDNLDNRTIYDELKQFVKNKKINRQIIIVSHNANLVVSTDAENIIVANQSGQQLGKENKKFAFEYVSGALENTFLDPTHEGILFKTGIKEHVCEILEGGQEAFKKREMKYGFK